MNEHLNALLDVAGQATSLINAELALAIEYAAAGNAEQARVHAMTATLANDKAGAALAKVAAAINSQPVTTAPPAESETYPRDQVIEGATFHLLAPINPKWRPSQEALMMSNVLNAARSGERRALADPGLPPGARSPRGYPTFAGRPQFQNASAATDDEMDAYIAKVSMTPEQTAAAIEASNQNMREVAGQVHPTTPPAAAPSSDVEEPL